MNLESDAREEDDLDRWGAEEVGFELAFESVHGGRGANFKRY
jgi:hypothetical protein